MTKSLLTLLTRKLCMSRIDKLLGVLLILCFLLTGAVAYGGKRVQYSSFVGDSSPKICAATASPTKPLKSWNKGSTDQANDLKNTRHSVTSVSDPFMDGGGTLLSLMFTVNTKDSGQAVQTGRRNQRIGMKKIKLRGWDTVHAPSCAVDFRG